MTASRGQERASQSQQKKNTKNIHRNRGPTYLEYKLATNYRMNMRDSYTSHYNEHRRITVSNRKFITLLPTIVFY